MVKGIERRKAEVPFSVSGAFHDKLSGSGLVAPCGMLFNRKYKSQYHIGNITEKSFKEIWQSERYWEVMNLIASDKSTQETVCARYATSIR